jgi:hypothetical protein
VWSSFADPNGSKEVFIVDVIIKNKIIYSRGNKMKKFFALIILLNTCGCASISSTPYQTGDSGLIYYMPNRDILLTITVEKGYGTKIAITTSESYPDMSQVYNLNHSGGVFGKNVADVQVVNGLIKASKATMTSNVNEVFKNAASAVATLKFRSKDTAPIGDAVKNICADGDHKFRIPARSTKTSEELCNVRISVTNISDSAPTLKTDAVSGTVAKAGIYYRQNIPLLVSAESPQGNEQVSKTAAIVFSPSGSATYFLPISKTFFANNAADFSFDGGVPTSYKQDTDGEAIALLKLPADIFGAYFEAIGKVFDAFKSQDTRNESAMQSNLTFEIMKQKYNECMDAVQAGDQEKLVALKCGEKL